MLIEGEVILARPDSGSEENIIAAEVLSSLSLETNTTHEHRKSFRLANGSYFEALGQVVIDCTFARDRSLQLCCVFYVFKQLICPILMGMPFLNDTETLGKHRHRLQARASPSMGPIEVSSLNSPRQRLYCLANSQPSLTNADTASLVGRVPLLIVLGTSEGPRHCEIFYVLDGLAI